MAQHISGEVVNTNASTMYLQYVRVLRVLQAMLRLDQNLPSGSHGDMETWYHSCQIPYFVQPGIQLTTAPGCIGAFR